MEDIKILAVANHKGGVGKTTVVENVAPLLAHAGYRTLMIDLDPQCSLTETFIDYEPEKTAYDAFLSPKTAGEGLVIPGTEFKNPTENLFLIASSPDMENLEFMLSGKTGRERILEKILRNIDAGQKYDVVMIDCPPDLGIGSINALVASTELYVPSTPEVLPLKGLKQLESKCESLAEDFNPNLRITGIIVNRYNSSKNLNVSVDGALRKKYGDTVFKTRIRDNVRIAESPQLMKNVVYYAPSSNGAKDFIALTNEIIDRLEGTTVEA